MLAYLIQPGLMVKNYEFARAVNSVFVLLKGFFKDEILDRLQEDVEFCGDDLSFFLQQCHLIAFFRIAVKDPSVFFLTQVMIAHCVRSVSNPEHCLAISDSKNTKHIFKMSPNFLADECFVQRMFHDQPLNTAKFIPFVMPFLSKEKLKALCLEKKLPELKVTVLKRVYHQAVHKSMLKLLKQLISNMISEKQLDKNVYFICFDRQQSVQRVLEIVYTESVKCKKKGRGDNNFSEEFVTRLRQISSAKRVACFHIVAKATALSQDCVLLFQVLLLYDKQFETPLYKRFLIGKDFFEGYDCGHYLHQLEILQRYS